jgi:hypothetical protein
MQPGRPWPRIRRPGPKTAGRPERHENRDGFGCLRTSGAPDHPSEMQPALPADAQCEALQRDRERTSRRQLPFRTRSPFTW